MDGSPLLAAAIGNYDVRFWFPGAVFCCDVCFLVASNSNVAGDPINDEVLVAVADVVLDVSVQGNVVTMWVTKVVNCSLAVCVNDDVSC